LKIKVEPIILAVVLCTLAISMFYASLTANAQPNPAESVNPNIQKAYSELKAADDAGANISELAARFNTALELLDKANNGNDTNTSDLIAQANRLLSSIPPDSQNLKSAATAGQQEAARLRIVRIPVGALIVALVAVAILVIRRKVQAKRFAELRVKVKG